MSILKIKAPTTLDKMVELSNLQSSPFDGKKWYIEVMPCTDPTCACKNSTLLFRDEHQVNTSQFSFQIEGDLATEKFNKMSFSTTHKGGDLALLANPNLLLEESLTEEDWRNLNTVHRVSKGAFIEEYDLRKVDANFTMEQLKDPSSVVLFQEIFPLASYFYFDKKDNIPYLVLDQYCANYKCACSDMVLSFTKDGRDEAFAFRYNYTTKQVDLLDGVGHAISLQKASNYVRLLKDKFIDFDKKLKERNEILRHLFKKFTIRTNAQLAQTNKIAKQKIGRNEPCPCGSGKKYKRCCG